MKKTARAGFTLVELTLSLAFIGILSVAVVLIINNTVSAYQRGLILDHVNTLGADLVNDIQGAVTQASSRGASSECAAYYPLSESEAAARNLCLNDGGYKFVMVTSKTAGVDASVRLRSGEVLEDIPVWGAICTGAYSYIWNSGYFFSENIAEVMGAEKATLKYKMNGEEFLKSDFKMLKVRDNKRAVCASTVYDERDVNYAVNDFAGAFDITEGYPELAEAPEDLISADEYNELAIYDLMMARPAESTARAGALYTGALILGSVRGGMNIKASGQVCEAPNSSVGGPDYCAINRFNFAAQTGGGL